MECSAKGSFKMKTKLFVSLLLLTAAVAPRALAAAEGADRNLHTGRGQLLVTPVDDPAVKDVPPSPAVVPNDPKQVLQDYDSLMIALTQKFSATLATIAEAVKRGEVSSEQAREVSAEQYQLTHMQFELLSLWRGIEEQDSARIPDVEAKPDSMREITNLIDAGLVHVPPINVLALGDAALAHHMIETGHVRGKLVLKVAELSC